MAPYALGLLLLLAAQSPARHVVAISHRGEHLHHPENTIPAFEQAIRDGADFIEVDVRTSADGQLVLSHDATVNRCTNGKGEVAKMTFDELRALDAGGAGFPGTKIPTFDEVLDLARGHIGIYVDVKQVSAKELVDHIVSHGMADHVVIYSGRTSAAEIQELNPKLKIMPESQSVETVQSIVAQLHPGVIAFDARDFRPEIIRIAKESGAEVYVDRMGFTDNPQGWQAAIDAGADGIQSDRPAELVAYLREKGYKAPAATPAASHVDFVKDVQPILAANCYVCHGPNEKTRMASLRLDSPDAAAKLARQIHARVASQDPAKRMPLGGQLQASQIATIRTWAEQAPDKAAHWAFVAPRRPEVPSGRNAIDYFVQEKLAKEGLSPSPSADKATLIRRVSLDLTGLPPTPAEVDAFLADHSVNAYEKVVDRLLQSPHYGERMATQWLDLARYADTHGYHIDSHRDMWPWRDWVVDAYNRNLPFDQFTVWQLAGDLLPNATREQKLASGFNRNHMINYEGGAIPEEYLVEYAVDRVEATSNTWLGLTMGCARCHDHKYDPIKQKEFYQFFAFFNNVADQGLDGKKGNAEPLLRLSTPEQEAKLAELDASVKSLEKSLAPEAITAQQAAWEKTRLAMLAAPSRDGLLAGLLVHYEFDGNLSDSSGHYQTGRVTAGEANYSDGPVGRSLSLSGEARVELTKAAAFDSGDKFTIATWIKSNSVLEMGVLQKIDSETTRHGFELRILESRPQPHLRRASRLEIRLTHQWPDNAIVLRTHDALHMGSQDGASPQHHYVLSYDGSGKAAGVRLIVDAVPVALDIVQDALSGSISSDSPLATGNHFQAQLDDLRVYNRALTAAEIRTLVFDEPVRGALWSGPADASKRNGGQKGILREAFLSREGPDNLRAEYVKLKDLRREKLELEYAIPTAMIMGERKEPRETHLLGRGDYANPKEIVTAGVPAVLPPLPSGAGGAAPANRLTLARWLVDAGNPLTSRVAVNRFWQMYFGNGLVKTSEDFGTRGDAPSHPELLDWLATEFVRGGWDVRAMQRLIVTSATYRQTANASAALEEKDPENRLLARGPRFRLPAEMIRDNALAVSGLLNPKIGGPAVFPYQPPGLWEEISFGDVYSSQYYEPSHGDDLYRRSLYTFLKRTAPPPELTIFDAPDRQKCTARRGRTNTPLQALVLMNDPTYVEASRALAARVLAAETSDASRIRLAFRLATARLPDASEQGTLARLVLRQLAHYRQRPADAEALLHVGESPVSAKLDRVELAAWTTVAEVILNLDETISR